MSASPRLRGPTSRVSAAVDLWAQAFAFPMHAPVGLVLLALGPVLRAWKVNLEIIPCDS